MEEFNYADLMNLGFERKNMSDSVFLDQHGYEWFLVELQLTTAIRCEWDCETRFLEIVRYDKKGNVLNRTAINSIEDLKLIIDVFKGENPKRTIERDPSIYSAC